MVEEWYLRRLPSNARERLIRTGTGVLTELRAGRRVSLGNERDGHGAGTMDIP